MKKVNECVNVLNLVPIFSEEFTPTKRPKPDGIVMEKTYPPYNGFGGEEDSLGNCKDLIPKPPRKNFIQFMEKDKQGLDSKVLRFLAKLESNIPTDKNRNFIISYYLSDDTIEVFEPHVNNSGWLTFLKTPFILCHSSFSAMSRNNGSKK